MNSRPSLLNILLVVALMSGSMTSCARSSNEEFRPAYWPTQNWKDALPEEQGLDSAQLVRMFEHMQDNDISVLPRRGTCSQPSL